MAFGSLVDFAEGGAAAAAEEIDGGIGGDSRQPVRRFLFVLELFLMLEGLDEGLLRQILGVRDISHDAIDLHEDPPQVIGNKAILSLRSSRPGSVTSLIWLYTAVLTGS